MANKIGLSCKMYRNTGSFGTPTWVEITIVRDATLNLEAGEAEVSSRASTFKEYLQALKDAGIEFDILYDGTDVNFVALKDAFINAGGGVTEDIAAMDGNIATTGNQGLRIVSIVTGFTRNEPLEEVVTISVTIKPTPNVDSDPVWFVVP